MYLLNTLVNHQNNAFGSNGRLYWSISRSNGLLKDRHAYILPDLASRKKKDNREDVGHHIIKQIA